MKSVNYKIRKSLFFVLFLGLTSLFASAQDYYLYTKDAGVAKIAGNQIDSVKIEGASLNFYYNDVVSHTELRANIDSITFNAPQTAHEVVAFDRTELNVVKVSAGGTNNNMFDGNESTMYHSYFNEWWVPENKPFYAVVDLAKARHIAKIELYRRNGADSPDTKTVKFYVGDASSVTKTDNAVEPEGVGTAWTSIGEIQFEDNLPTNDFKTLEVEDAATNGRYLLLFFPDSWNEHANVTELYLYGWDI